MYTTHVLGHSLTGRRITMATLIVAFCITLALAIGGTAPANAAGPDRLAPGDSVTYPTWGFGGTKVCVTNAENQPGMIRRAAPVERWPER